MTMLCKARSLRSVRSACQLDGLRSCPGVGQIPMDQSTHPPINEKEMNQTPATILVVDDDPGIQRLAAQILRTEGYNVLVASERRTRCPVTITRRYRPVDHSLMLPSERHLAGECAPRETAGLAGDVMSGFTADGFRRFSMRRGQRRFSRNLPGADAPDRFGWSCLHRPASSILFNPEPLPTRPAVPLYTAPTSNPA